MPENLQEKSHLRRYWPRWFLGLSPIVFVATIYFIGTIDIDPPDVSDVLPIREEVADEENAYVKQVELTRLEGLKSYRDLINAVEDGGEYDKKAWDALVRIAEFQTFDEMIARSQFQSAEITSINQLFPEFGSTQRWIQLACLEVEKSKRTDRHKYERLLAIENFCIKMRSRSNSLIENLVGLTVESITHAYMARLLTTCQDETVLKEILARKVELAPLKNGCKRVMRSEFLFCRMATQEMLEEQGSSLDLFGNGFDQLLTFKSYLIHPNRMDKDSADIIRYFWSEIDKEQTGHAASKAFDTYMLNKKDKIFTFRGVIRPNLGGRILLDMMRPAYGNMYIRSLGPAVEINCLKAIAALQLYKQAEGRYPKSLKELVPQYLSELPRDPANDEVLGYNLSEGKVYSFGEDLVDDAGDNNSDDIFYHFDREKFLKFTREQRGEVD